MTSYRNSYLKYEVYINYDISQNLDMFVHVFGQTDFFYVENMSSFALSIAITFS